jgi:hypothetical protein
MEQVCAQCPATGISADLQEAPLLARIRRHSWRASYDKARPARLSKEPAAVEYVWVTNSVTISWLAKLAANFKEVGPIAMIAIFVPGGSLIALLVWFVKHRWSRNGTHQDAA